MIDDAPSGHALQIGESGVDRNRVREDQPAAFPVFGDIGDARVNRLTGRMQLDFLPVDFNGPGDLCAVAVAENGHCQFCAAGAHQS